MFDIVVLGTAHPHIFDLAKAVTDIDNAQLVGVWDPDTKRLTQAAKRLASPPIQSLAKALAIKPALALIGAVPKSRASLARQAIRAGAAVLADKPLAVTHGELDKTIEAFEKYRRPVITFYPYRGEPFIRAAKATLDTGSIGKLVRVMSCGPHKLNPNIRPDWHWTRRHNGGCIIDVGSHHADICCWVAGEAPDWLCATHVNLSRPRRRGFQDFAQAQLRFPCGALGHIEADWVNPESMNKFGDTRTWIQGTTGKIEVRIGDERSGYVWTKKEAEKPLDITPYESGHQWMVNLITDLSHDRPIDIPQQEVWRASRVTLHAFDSAQAKGKPIAVAID